MPANRDEIAVAIHDIEPATFARVALIRDWLDDHGIDRATLLVVPAPDLHPLQDRDEGLVDWLSERRCHGDAIAQHGLRDRCEWRSARTPAALLARRRPDAEFAALDADETRRAVEAGWRILRLAGLEPSGFVAPAYAYTAALHATLPRRFAWWAGARRLYRPDGPAGGTAVGSAIGLDAAGRLRRLAAPCVQRARAATAGRVLRLDLKPRDLDSRRHVAAVERILTGASERASVTLDEVALRAS